MRKTQVSLHKWDCVVDPRRLDLHLQRLYVFSFWQPLLELKFEVPCSGYCVARKGNDLDCQSFELIEIRQSVVRHV